MWNSLGTPVSIVMLKSARVHAGSGVGCGVDLLLVVVGVAIAIIEDAGTVIAAGKIWSRVADR